MTFYCFAAVAGNENKQKKPTRMDGSVRPETQKVAYMEGRGGHRNAVASPVLLRSVCYSTNSVSASRSSSR